MSWWSWIFFLRVPRLRPKILAVLNWLWLVNFRVEAISGASISFKTNS